VDPRAEASDYPAASLLAQLEDPAAYPHDPEAGLGIEWRQTHLSHVFLTRGRVYKFRKPVDLPFVCFASRGARNADCLREVALNRRLAPDVYLGVAPLTTLPGGVRIGAVSEELCESGAGPLEHCVVMRRLPEGRDAESLLAKGELSTGQLERLADRMAGFHELHGLGVPAPFTEAGWLERCTEPLFASLRALEESRASLGEALAPARERAETFARDHAGRFERRRVRGRAVDAHGDLHLQHVFFERDDAEPLVIDCLEFDRGLREIDVAAEVAFTAMDLSYRGHPELASRFLRRYAQAADDFDLFAVVDYFQGYRAAVRAKVAAIAASEPEIDAAQRLRAAESARRHVEFAAQLLAPRAAGALVLVGGVVGSGKSTAAARLAEALDRTQGVALLSSDRVRKHMAGIDALERTVSGPDAGLYAPEAVARTYAGLLARAEPVLRSGRAAVLDATWSSREERARARALADSISAPVVFVEVRCDPSLLEGRLARRQQAGADPSDAGPERLAVSLTRFEPSEPGEGLRHEVLHTDAPDWGDAVALLASRLAAQSRRSAKT